MRPSFSASILPLTLIAITGMTTANTRAQEVGNVQRGLKLAEQVCAQCHLVVKGAGVSPSADAPPFQAIASTPGITSTALVVALRTSHRTMPNLVVERDQADDVIAYILSLKETK
jgi:mono/diheme cytochrome c family protein